MHLRESCRPDSGFSPKMGILKSYQDIKREILDLRLQDQLRLFIDEMLQSAGIELAVQDFNLELKDFQRFREIIAWCQTAMKVSAVFWWSIFDAIPLNGMGAQLIQGNGHLAWLLQSDKEIYQLLVDKTWNLISRIQSKLILFSLSWFLLQDWHESVIKAGSYACPGRGGILQFFSQFLFPGKTMIFRKNGVYL